MPWGDGTGPWWAGGFGRGWRGRGFGRWFGYGPKGYCWYYYQQTGQFPPWSPWNYWYNQGNLQVQNPVTQSSTSLDQLEAMKRSLEEQLKTIEDQIKELKRKGD